MTRQTLGALALTLAATTYAGDLPRSLSVDQAVSYGLANSPEVRAAEADAAAARAELSLARAKLGPQLSLNGFLSNGSMPSVLQSPMGAEPQALILAPDDEFADANLMLMMPLYTSGGLEAGRRAAAARALAAEAEAGAMRAEVALRIRTSYWQSVYATEQVKAQQARLAAAQAMVRNTRATFEVGRGIEASVRRAEAELAEAQSELTMAETERQKMLLELLAEMGAPLDSTIEISQTFGMAEPNSDLHSSLKESNLKRGELIAAKRRVAAAEAVRSAAQGAQGPQVYGFAMAESFSPADEMGERSGYTVGLAASLPLFDSGMRRSEVVVANAMVARAREEARRVALQVEKEVRSAWLDIGAARQNVHTAQAAVEAATSSYEVVSLRVESGKSIQVEQLDALAALTRARANLAKSLFEYHVALARLERAVGNTGARPEGAINR